MTSCPTISYTAIIAGFLISALGGSRVQIGGATGAFVVIVYGIVQRFGVDGLIVATMGSVPADFLEKWGAFAEHIRSVNPYALGVAAMAVAVIIAWPRINRRIPGPFVALLVATAVVQLFHLPVETIGSRFGGINASLPMA